MSWGATFCLITGASRGIGQAIAVEFSKKLGEGSVLLLLARTQAGLDETKKLVEKVNDRVQVHPVTIDLQKAGSFEYKKAIEDCLENEKKVSADFKRAILVHNAATSNKNFALQLEDVSNLQDDLNLNFVSPILLNTQFFKIFDKNLQHRTVIQISSGVSKMPMSRLGMYGSVKAARNHFFSTLALEEPTIRVLNYGPGLVNTEMFRKSNAEDGRTYEETVKMFDNLGFKVHQPEETASVLVGYLEGDFESGAFMSVYKNSNIYNEKKEKVSEIVKEVKK